MKLTQTHRVCVRKTCHIAQLFLTQVRKFYCFRPGPYIFYKYAWHNHLSCPIMAGSISQNVAFLNSFVHDVIKFLYNMKT